MRGLLSVARRLAILAGAAALAGCTTTARLTLMPTIDTTRAPGFQAAVSFAPGIPFSDRRAIVMPVSVGGGFRKAAKIEPIVPITLGLEYLQIGLEAGKVGFRAGAHERIQVLPAASAAVLGPAVQAALLPTLWAGTEGGPRAARPFLALGPALDASWLWKDGKGPSFGQIGLGLSLEWISQGSLFLP